MNESGLLIEDESLFDTLRSSQSLITGFKQVKKNKGKPGMDGVSIEDFESRLSEELSQLSQELTGWTYKPSPVRRVEILKPDGKGVRLLGIPAVLDRVAQAVAKLSFEPLVEPHFLGDSYGYRPGKSAHQALDVTRKRCWRYDWVLEFDIRGLFDNIDHCLLMKAVKRHTDNP